MKVFFIEGYDHPQVHLEADMDSQPNKEDLIQIGDQTYHVNNVRHVFEPTGRGGRYEYFVKVQVQKL